MCEGNILHNRWRLVKIPIPDAVEFYRLFTTSSQKAGQRLHIEPVARSLLRVRQVIIVEPAAVLHHRMREVASAAGCRSNVLHLRHLEVHLDRSIPVRERLNAQLRRELFLPRSTRQRLSRPGIEHEAHSINPRHPAPAVLLRAAPACCSRASSPPELRAANSGIAASESTHPVRRRFSSECRASPYACSNPCSQTYSKRRQGSLQHDATQTNTSWLLSVPDPPDTCRLCLCPSAIYLTPLV